MRKLPLTLETCSPVLVGASTHAFLSLGACVTSRGADEARTPATPEVARAATFTLLEYAAESFPGTWSGIPAEIYCIQSPDLVPTDTRHRLAERLKPAAECSLDLRPSAPVAEQRVRHIPSGRPAVIYTFGPAWESADGTVQIDFTWFGAYHFSGGYRCVITRRDTVWETRRCIPTSDY